MKRLALATALTAALATPIHAEESRELGSHEHGHVELKVAIDGDTLLMELEAPGENIVGFEHAATTDEQKSAVEAASAQLKDADAVIVLPAAAGCTLASAKSELHQEGDHNAFEASYSYTCSDIGKLASFSTKLFTLYPSIKEIEVQYATPGGQGEVELEAGSTVVNLPTTS